jgi:hypothetical protein
MCCGTFLAGRKSFLVTGSIKILRLNDVVDSILNASCFVFLKLAFFLLLGRYSPFLRNIEFVVFLRSRPYSLVALVVSSPTWAEIKYTILPDKEDERFTTYGTQSCTYYLDVYSRTTLKGKATSAGLAEWWGVDSWISGYLTAYNQFRPNSKKDILGSMSTNSARKWIASWCRDNSVRDVLDAIGALIKGLK